MTSAAPGILTVNGGSSSIRCAWFPADGPLLRTLSGKISGIGLTAGSFTTSGLQPEHDVKRALVIPDHARGMEHVMEWLLKHVDPDAVTAVGHRVVHGGPDYWQAQRISAAMLAELQRITAFDPEHLPSELQLIAEFQRRFPRAVPVACFDTAFHHDLPLLAQLLPIPRKYFAQGVRRYGFHGLSYAFLLEELARLAGPAAALGRLVLCHLGNGASMAAVQGGRCQDTTMAFTPAAGLVMGTRAGDIDPGLASFLARSEQMTPARFDQVMNHESGLLGISETSSDMRELLVREADDSRAADAVAMFCYQAKKQLGAYAAALGGIDTVVFAGGIGEHAPPVRARICAGLDFLGIDLDPARNAAQDPVISSAASRVVVRVIRTDEEHLIARSVLHVLRKTDDHG